MLKGLAILAVFIAGVQGSVPTTRKAVSRSSYADTEPKTQTDNSEKPALPSPSIGSVKDSNGQDFKGDSGKKHSTNNQAVAAVIETPATQWRKREWATFWANLVLAIVGIGGIVVGVCTLIFISRQAGEMRLQRIAMRNTLNTIKIQTDHMSRQADLMGRQTKILEDSVTAAQKSAEAADRSAHAAVRISAPILVLQKLTLNHELFGKTPEAFFKKPEVRIEVKNFGQSPAFLKSYVVDFMCLKKLPEYPIYSEPWHVDMQEVIDAGTNYVVGEGRCTSRRGLDIACAEVLATGTKTMLVYGYLIYGDIFGSPLRTMKFSKIVAEAVNAQSSEWTNDPLIMDWGSPHYTGQEDN